MSSQVALICIGRFYYFHVARQLEKRNALHSVTTGYPRFKLRDEVGVPAEKIRSFPWLNTPYLGLRSFGCERQCAMKTLSWWNHQGVDWYGSINLEKATTVIALSSSGLQSGRRAKREGKAYICDRASSHIRHQDAILADEYGRWGLAYRKIDPRIVEKEEAEYALADQILVPSQFVRETFVARGVASDKIARISFGINLDRFRATGDPPSDEFRVLYVGAVSIRKGFLYLLKAFEKLRHPRKKLIVIGHLTPEVRALSEKFSLESVEFRGTIPNAELSTIYSTSHVFVQPSVEEGLSLVMGEAMACGCPVIATPNTGAMDLFEDGVEGKIVPARDSAALADGLRQLAEDRDARDRFGAAALDRSRRLGGWDDYGQRLMEVVAKCEASL